MLLVSLLDLSSSKGGRIGVILGEIFMTKQVISGLDTPKGIYLSRRVLQACEILSFVAILGLEGNAIVWTPQLNKFKLPMFCGCMPSRVATKAIAKGATIHSADSGSQYSRNYTCWRKYPYGWGSFVGQG